MDGGAWCPWGPKELDTTARLHFHFIRMISGSPLKPLGIPEIDRNAVGKPVDWKIRPSSTIPVGNEESVK